MIDIILQLCILRLEIQQHIGRIAFKTDEIGKIFQENIAVWMRFYWEN
jgi:hypothetical protein